MIPAGAPPIPEEFWDLVDTQTGRIRRAVEIARLATPLGIDFVPLERSLAEYESAVQARDFERYGTTLEALHAALVAAAPHVAKPATLQ